MKVSAPACAAGMAIVLTVACACTDSSLARRPAEPMKPVAVTVADAADEETTMRVETSLLADPLVKGFRIDVDTHDGVVYLTGVVENENE